MSETVAEKMTADALKMLEDFIQAGEYVGSHWEFGEIHRTIRYLQQENERLNDLLKTRSVPLGTPTIVCLCGSTRFMEAFFDAGWRFTLEGKIVLSIGVCKHAEDHGGEALGQDVADRLDELHFRKIDLADEVYVLNVDGYIGESTRKEIEYAKSKDKPIRYLQALEAKNDS